MARTITPPRVSRVVDTLSRMILAVIVLVWLWIALVFFMAGLFPRQELSVLQAVATGVTALVWASLFLGGRPTTSQLI